MSWTWLLTESFVRVSAMNQPIAVQNRTRPRSLTKLLSIKNLSKGATFIPPAALIFITLVLLIEALPAIKYNGFGFLTQSQWKPGNFYANSVVTNGVAHPVGASYGGLPLILGTLESSILALVIAVPISIGAAMVIVDKLPPKLSQTIGFFLEVLAGIPSVIFGLWGTLVLGPILARNVFPWIARILPNVIGLRFFKGNVGHGEGLLTSGIVLAIMVIPIIASTSRDLLRQVPKNTREGGTALGFTSWETNKWISLPWVKTGLIGASVLGLARALGETMAVAMTTGVVLGATPQNAYLPMTTIAATIVSQLDSALTDATGLATHTLAEAALILAVITLLTNVAARLLVKKVSTTALPVGRGI